MLKTLATAFLAVSAGAAGLTAASAADCAIKAPGDLLTANTITFGSMLSTPPQVFDDKGEPAGSDVDIAKAVAARMCVKAQFVNLAFAGLFPGLNAKKFDAAVAGIGITPQRQESFDFVPYFYGGVRLVVRKATKLEFKDENELCGRSVATVTGTVEARALDRLNQETCAEGKKIEVKIYPSFNEAVQQLRKSVVDVAYVDWPFANYIVNLAPDLAVGSPVLSGTPGRPRNKQGIVVRKGNAALHDAMEQALAQVMASGDYDKILDKWHLKEGDVRLSQ